MYNVTFVQYIAPEYSDNQKTYYAIKEVELPFIPSTDRHVGIEWSVLGNFVWHIQSVHYNMDKDRFYATLNSYWAQVWTGVDYNNYDHEATIKELDDYIGNLRAQGWEIVERKDLW